MNSQVPPRAVTACFTGHRQLREPAAELTLRVSAAVTDLVQSGYIYFCAGGARGFDALASEAVITLQARYPQIQLILMLPFAEQYRHERGWSGAEIEQYHRLQAQASQVLVLAPGYRSGVYYQRNRQLVDASSVCITYLSRPNSGTGYTVRYAQTRGLRIIHTI